MSNKERIGDFIYDKSSLYAYLFGKLPGIKREGFEIICSHNFKIGGFGSYNIKSNHIDIGLEVKDWSELIVDSYSVQPKKSTIFEIEKNRQVMKISHLMLYGYNLSRLFAISSLSMEEQLIKYYKLAIECKLLEDSEVNLKRFVISSVLWHEATHAADRLNPICGRSLEYIGKRVQLYSFLPFLLTAIASFTELLIRGENNILLSVTNLAFFSTYLLGAALQVRSEFSAVKSQTQINELVELANHFTYHPLVIESCSSEPDISELVHGN